MKAIYPLYKLLALLAILALALFVANKSQARQPILEPNTWYKQFIGLPLSYSAFSERLGKPKSSDNAAIVTKPKPKNTLAISAVFTKIEVSGGFKIIIRNSDTSAVSIETPEGSESVVGHQISNGKLLVYKLNGLKGDANREVVTIMAPVIENVKIDYCKSYNISLKTTSVLSIDVSGATNGTIKSVADSFSLWVHGGSNANASMFARTANIKVNGASFLKGNLTTQYLTINQSGASSIDLKGKANRANCMIGGASTFLLKNFEIDKLNFESQGASTAYVRVLTEIDAKVRGASTVVCFGKPNKVVKEVTTSSSFVLHD